MDGNCYAELGRYLRRRHVRGLDEDVKKMVETDPEQRPDSDSATPTNY